MKMHVLPGDSLVKIFKQTNIEGEIVVCRECLIDGDLAAENLEDFWRVRKNYLSNAYSDSEKPEDFYEKEVKQEFEKLLDAPQNTEINLWFEYELFCQTNMWFCLFLLQNSSSKIYRVEPIVRNEEDIWNGFGGLSESDLEKCFAARKEFSDEELKLGADLWKTFQNKDFAELRKLSHSVSKSFPYLNQVCEAAIEKETRPKDVLRKIIADGESDFGKVFKKFNKTEGIYGFGDLQVKKFFDEMSEPSA